MGDGCLFPKNPCPNTDPDDGGLGYCRNCEWKLELATLRQRVAQVEAERDLYKRELLVDPRGLTEVTWRDRAEQAERERDEAMRVANRWRDVAQGMLEVLDDLALEAARCVARGAPLPIPASILRRLKDIIARLRAPMGEG